MRLITVSTIFKRYGKLVGIKSKRGIQYFLDKKGFVPVEIRKEPQKTFYYHFEEIEEFMKKVAEVRKGVM